MKAVCISACQISGIGIVTAGEEVELPDGLANDARVNTHFVIDRKTIKNANAEVPDFEKDCENRRKNFAASLVNESLMLAAIAKLSDEGVSVPNEVIDRDALPVDERIERVVDLWTAEFGCAYPTDPVDPKKEKRKKDKMIDVPKPTNTGKGSESKEDDLFGKE